jgi:SAM-dependent methyltransferase
MKRFSPVGRHTRRWILKLIRMVEKPQSIVDIGCGDGTLLSHIGKHYTQTSLFGCDFSSASVRICRERLPRAVFALHDILTESNPFGRVMDVGISSEVIEHVEDDAAAVKNMAMFCRYLILTVPGGKLDESSRQMGHLRHYSRLSLHKVAENAGLDIFYSRSWGFPLAYPLYAWLRNRAGYSAVTGKYGPAKRTACHFLFGLFYINDLFASGNKIFLLARNPRLNP